jgi:citrate lyase beta subunit
MHRSFLMIPAIKLNQYWQHLCRSADASLPDCVVIDLEDSVPPSRKGEASSTVRSALRQGLPPMSRPMHIMVKIDNPRSPYFDRQISELEDVIDALQAIKIGKVQCPEELDQVQSRLSSSKLPLFPTIETPKGFVNREKILAWSSEHGVEYASLGAGDMASCLLIDIDHELDILRYIFSELVVACAIHSIFLVDSPSIVIPKSKVDDWRAQITRECVWAFQNGAKSKTAIHPAQIPAIHQAWEAHFDIGRADRIEEQFRKEPNVRFFVDDESGDYIGTPSLAAARKLKALVGSFGARRPEAA